MLLLENNDNKYYDYNLTINENGINERKTRYLRSDPIPSGASDPSTVL